MHDEVIPFANTESLYERMPRSRATLTVIPGVGHNDISESPEISRLYVDPHDPIARIDVWYDRMQMFRPPKPTLLGNELDILPRHK
jgi:pimeloyl-ACP methyl ester carboxylesterase